MLNFAHIIPPDISYLAIAYKVFAKVNGNGFRETVDYNQSNDQVGYCKGYSTIDHIQTINKVLEICAEYKKSRYIAFTDYEKVFGSVETTAVKEALRNQGVDEPYVNVMENIYRGSTATIVLHRQSDRSQ